MTDLINIDDSTVSVQRLIFLAFKPPFLHLFCKIKLLISWGKFRLLKLEGKKQIELEAICI